MRHQTWVASVLQTSAMDGGSPFYEHLAGQRAAHGALGVLIGDSFRVGWNDLAIL